VVDNHAHLDHARAGEQPWDVREALAAAAAVNVTRAIQIGCELPSARWTVQAVAAHPTLLGGVALHPTEASALVTSSAVTSSAVTSAPDAVTGWKAFEAAFAEIEALAGHPRVRVIGETGLDHHWVPAEDVEGRAAQEESFRRHIDLAKRLGKVLQIHDRDAHDDVLRILDAEGAPERTVLHCFSGDAAMARRCLDNGWYLSFAGNLTFRNASGLREALAVAGPGSVLVETDAPYLAPMPHRGRPNASYLVPLTVRCMAEVLGTELEELCRVLDATSERLYGPW